MRVPGAPAAREIARRFLPARTRGRVDALAGAVAVGTGSSSGTGRAACLALARSVADRPPQA